MHKNRKLQSCDRFLLEALHFLFSNDNDDDNNNKITFKRTRSLSNTVCFKHDNNVCACAVSALILFPVVNLPLEIDSATSISYMTSKVLPFDAAFRLFWRFFTAHAQFRPY